MIASAGSMYLWLIVFFVFHSCTIAATITPRKLDHFNYQPQSYQTFRQRYLIKDKYWGGANKNAPIFVYTGNEGDIKWFVQNTGFMIDYAPYFKALLIVIEHRFYGKSIPFGGDIDVAYSNASTLGYLSSTQALVDYATLIIDLKKNLTAENSPVLVRGGSYGGRSLGQHGFVVYSISCTLNRGVIGPQRLQVGVQGMEYIIDSCITGSEKDIVPFTVVSLGLE